MSNTRIFQLALTKLYAEWYRPDHNLRVLVGHANLLDSLHIHLANEEEEKLQYLDADITTARTRLDESYDIWGSTDGKKRRSPAVMLTSRS